MLVVYTSNEYLDKGKDLSWCRELVSSKIRYMPISKSFSVYGVVDGKGSYRPGNINPIKDHDPVIGKLISSLFHTTLGLASRIVLNTGPTLHDYSTAWCYRQEVPLSTESTIDMNDPQDVGIGSIVNLPAWVGQSIALTSFLLYLPRVWYNLAQKQYTGNCQYMKTAEVPILLGTIAKYLAEPLYQMPQGGAAFWSFLDFLITANDLKSPDAKTLLLNNTDCDGYNTWFDRLAVNHPPGWCSPIVERNKFYNKYGATAMVNLKIKEGAL